MLDGSGRSRLAEIGLSEDSGVAAAGETPGTGGRVSAFFAYPAHGLWEITWLEVDESTAWVKKYRCRINDI